MVISPLIWVITIVTLPVTPLITTHEPPSSLATEALHPRKPKPQHKTGHPKSRDPNATVTASEVVVLEVLWMYRVLRMSLNPKVLNAKPI